MNSNSSKSKLSSQKITVYDNLTFYRLAQINLIKHKQQKNQSVWESEKWMNLREFLNFLLSLHQNNLPNLIDKKSLLLSNFLVIHLAQKVINSQFNSEGKMNLSTKIDVENPSISALQFLNARETKAYFSLVNDEEKKSPIHQKIFNQLNFLFEKELNKNNYFDEVSLIQFLINQFNPSLLKDFEVDLCLNEPNPLIAKLINQLNLKPKPNLLNSDNQSIAKVNLAQPTKPKVYQFEKRIDEFEYLIHQVFEHQKNNPDELILVLFNHFDLFESSIKAIENQNQQPFSVIHSGHSIIKTKVFSDALSVLRFSLMDSVLVDDLIGLFSSMSFYHHSLNKKSFINNLKSLKTRYLDWNQFIQILASFDTQLSHKLNETVAKLLAKPNKSYLDFSQFFADFLFELKWQIDSNHNCGSENWQMLHQILDDLSKLDLLKIKCSSTQFLKSLEDLLKRKKVKQNFYTHHVIFIDLEDLTDLNPIDFFSIFSATNFSLWIAGLDDGYPKTKPINSFLNSAEQRQKSFYSNQIKVFEKAKNWMNNFKKQKIIGISFSNFENEITTEVSPVIANNLDDYQWIENQKLPNDDNQKVQRILIEDKIKNTNIFKHASVSRLDSYNQCNFLGFARLVLDKHKTEITSKPTARERGILVHQMIENFYQKIPNMSAFEKAKNRGNLERIKTEVIEASLTTLTVFSQSYKNIEKQVLVNLLNAFTDCLVENKDFLIKQTEQKFQFLDDGFSVSGTVDWIEETNNSTNLVDLKTNSPNEQNQSIQLIVYYWLLKKNNKQIDNATYFNLYFEKAAATVSKKNSLQQEYLDSCMDLIDDFLKAYQSGSLVVNFDASICKDCEFRALCRIDEQVS